MIIFSIRRHGFTLAELLIALAILGVIATFTIPKVLTAQQNQQYTAIAKETIGTISGAYTTYQQNNSPTSGMSAADLSPYMNYVSVDTVTTHDDIQQYGSYACSNPTPCLKLHNGALLQFLGTFGGTNMTNALPFMLDPDGKLTDATTNNPGKSVRIFLYYNGRIATAGSASSTTTTGAGVFGGPYPQNDPPWMTWN